MFLVLWSSAVSIFSVSAYSIGVEKDDYIKWNLENDIPLLGGTIIQTGWIKITVLSIDGDRITVTYESHFDPGIPGTTPVDEHVEGYIDVSTGESSFQLSQTPLLGRPPNALIIPAGLSNNDDIPGIGTIQGIETHEGHAAVYIVTPGVGTSIETWWDRETGVMLETHFDFPYDSVTGSHTLKLAETNVWGPRLFGNDWWLWLDVIFAIGAVIYVASVITNTRKSKAVSEQSAATEVHPHSASPYVKGLGGTTGFVLSGVLGITLPILFVRFGGWWLSNFAQSAGQILSVAFGEWWLKGFAFIAGFIVAIFTWIMVSGLKRGFWAKLIEAVTIVTMSIVVAFIVGALSIFPAYWWLSGTNFAWDLVSIPLAGAAIVIPFIVSVYIAAYTLALAEGITKGRQKPREEAKTDSLLHITPTTFRAHSHVISCDICGKEVSEVWKCSQCGKNACSECFKRDTGLCKQCRPDP